MCVFKDERIIFKDTRKNPKGQLPHECHLLRSFWAMSAHLIWIYCLGIFMSWNLWVGEVKLKWILEKVNRIRDYGGLSGVGVVCLNFFINLIIFNTILKNTLKFYTIHSLNQI